MKRMTLGRTGMETAEMIFGTLPMGPLQKNVSVEESAKIIASALERGVDFVDTAQMYRTYPHLRRAMDMTGIRPMISSKSLSATYEKMEAAIHEALEALKVDYIDLFYMHAARIGNEVFTDYAGGMEALYDAKRKGLIRAVGISTHSVPLTRAAAVHPEVDVVFPLINKTGVGLREGTLADMEEAVELCFENNKGVVVMKALSGGTSVMDYVGSFEYVRRIIKDRAPIALGMVNMAELDMNLKFFNGEDISEELARLEAPSKAFFVFGSICKKCGRCIKECHSDAITYEEKCAVINPDKCLRCGYCVGSCPEFAIRMI